MKRLQWDDYTGTWVNPNHECSCYQASGDSASCRFHYQSEDRTLRWPWGVPYSAPPKRQQTTLRLIQGGRA